MTLIPDSTPTPAQLRAEYERGASLQTLSERHPMISIGTVRNRLHSAGTLMRPPGGDFGAIGAERNCRVLNALAREPSHELSCPDLAERLGLEYHAVHKALRRMVSRGLATSHDLNPYKSRGRRAYRLTESGLVHAVGLQSRSTSASRSEPLITAVTAQILLALLQHPIRSWRPAELANRVPCTVRAVTWFASAMEPAGWATKRRSTTRYGRRQVDLSLTDDGVHHAKAALRREYGDSPTLIILANAMHPPVKPIEV